MRVQRLDDRYEIIKELGSSVNSKVYLVRHIPLDVLRVAKIIMKGCGDFTRIRQEANLIKNLKHPDIPIIYDIEEDDNSICIIEEYIYGKSLRKYVEDNDVLNLKDICQIGINLCNILDYLHNFQKGIIHMDLKPDNIIIDGNNKVKLIDFDNSVWNNAGETVNNGSPLFAAPEQYSEDKAVVQSDIYSFGMLLMFMVSGGNLTEKDAVNFQEIGFSNNQLYPVIKKCIRHSPNLRYSGIRLLRKELEAIINNNMDNTSLKRSYCFYVSGIRNGIGVTNTVLCMAHFFVKNNMTCVVKDESSAGHLLNEALKGCLNKDGLYVYRKVKIWPDYNDVIAVDAKADVILVDAGVVDCQGDVGIKLDAGISSGCQCTNIIVAGGKYAQTDELRNFSKLKGDYAVFCNLLGGRDFYEYSLKLRNRKCYRVPCSYEWYGDNHIFDNVMMDFLQDNAYEVYKWLKNRKIRRKFKAVYERTHNVYVRFIQIFFKRQKR